MKCKWIKLLSFMLAITMAVAVEQRSVLMVQAANPGDILISEVLYDSPTNCTEPGAEWVELYNTTGSAITLTNWQICDNYTCDTIPTVTIQSGQGVVIAGTQTDFGNCYTCGSGHIVYVADGEIGNGLANGGDRVRIIDNNGIEIDAMSYGTDTYAFTPSCPDVSEGHSLERYPINQDTNSAGDFRDQSTPSPCLSPTAITLSSVTACSEQRAALPKWAPATSFRWLLRALIGAGLVVIGTCVTAFRRQRGA